jgi:hypothetical protein
LEPANYPDFVDLMSTNDSARACQCMWWMLRVTDFHANGEPGNAAAFRFATVQGASAVEGFPFQQGRRKSGDVQVGSQETFEGAGFQVARITSTARVVMRRDLTQ